MLTTEQANRITMAALRGKPDPIGTAESKRYYADVLKDVEKAKAAGQSIDLPHDIPDLGGDDEGAGK